MKSKIQNLSRKAGKYLKNGNSIMRKKTMFSLIAGLGMSTFLFAGGGETKLTIQPAASKVEWVGKKVAGSHNGTINIQKGTVNVTEGKLTGGSVEIDMSSIENLDMEGEYKKKLEGHLRSDDFFSVERHPVSTFEITNVSPTKEDGSKSTHTITGNLTIKGITHEISFPARVEIRDNKLAAYADFKIDRTKWKIRYGSGKFFDDLGDNMIDDHFSLKLSIAAAAL